MAVISGSAPSAAVAGWHQLQRVQAQRVAEQAEQEANALRNKAQSAEEKANQAKDEARDIGVRSDHAQERARVARSGAQSLEGWDKLLQGSTAQAQSVSPAVRAVAPTVASNETGATAVNAQGQKTGRIISVEA